MAVVIHTMLGLPFFYFPHIISLITALAQLCSARYQSLPVVNTIECAGTPACDPNSKFRPIDGSCVNLKHPSWGLANTPYLRIVPARYKEKEVSANCVSGKAQPNTRKISTSLFPDRIVPDPIKTLDLMQFGQTIAHDFANLALRRTASGSFAQCCTTNNRPLNPQDSRCMSVEIDPNDSFYKQYDVQCISLPRGKISDNSNCPKTESDQANLNTHSIDGSLVYGSDLDTAKRLRATGESSLGKMAIETTEDGRVFPPTAQRPQPPCDNRANESACYDAGDNRANQNIGIVVYQIALLRLHNYLCDELHRINPQWDDERLYQEARKLLGAMLQHITFKHFLPVILGYKFLKKKGINYKDHVDHCVNYYDSEINPGVFTEFSAAAFRSFHSLVPRDVNLVDKKYKEVSKLNLDDYYFRPSITKSPGTFDELIRGLVSQPQESQDQYISVTLTNYFNKQKKPYGVDLESTDITRASDLGLPTYNKLRKLCGLKESTSFHGFSGEMSQASIEKLQSLYSSHEDIPLFVGGMMEDLLPNTLVGPTFQCIIGEQFYKFQKGDSFYYENCGLPSSFTKEQRNAIYTTTLAWIHCKTGDNIQSMPVNTFRKTSKHNPIVPCSEIQAPDFSAWKETLIDEGKY